jgi:hypothetical protein
LFGFYNSSLSAIYENYFASTLKVSVILAPRSGYLDVLFPETADYRRQSQWTNSGSLTGSDAEFVKYRSFDPDEDNPEFWATFFGLMRISEAYYIAAEAYANLGEMEKACDYLNVIKSARGIQDLSSTNLTSANFLKELKFEYLREMRGEGQIFYMFKRFYQYFGMYYSGGVPDFDAAEVSYFDSSSSASARYNVPIPSDETY